MRWFKAFASLIIALSIVLICFCSAGAAVPDLKKWNSIQEYTVLDGRAESNCAIEYAMFKVRHEEVSNRLHFLFALTLDSIEDTDSAGISISFNDIGTVELYCDGTAEYDDGLFFAQLDSLLSDDASHMLLFEFTVGIKPGITDSMVISFNMYDTSGVASNTYEFDISQELAGYEEPDSGEDPENGESEKTAKAKTTKTTKVRTTKAKTTKTTKVKTTKVKTTKKSKTESDSEDEYGAESADSVQSISEDTIGGIETVNEKNRLVIICAAAVIACAAGGCIAGIINGRKNRGRGDKR